VNKSLSLSILFTWRTFFRRAERLFAWRAFIRPLRGGENTKDCADPRVKTELNSSGRYAAWKMPN
jgi:hypothetical protein